MSYERVRKWKRCQKYERVHFTDARAASGNRLRSILPARLGYARNQALGRQLTESETRQFEAADKRAAAARHFATVHNTRRTGIARQLRQAGIVLLRFQLSPQRSIFLHRRALAFIAINPGSLGHKKRLNLVPKL